MKRLAFALALLCGCTNARIERCESGICTVILRAYTYSPAECVEFLKRIPDDKLVCRQVLELD